MNNPASTTTLSRSLQLRGRRDLIAEPIQFRGTRYWSVKDPLALRYYQLCDEEMFILEQLDGKCSFDELKRRFEARFEPRKLDSNELYAFLGTLHREGLLTSQAAGQAAELLQRHDRAKRHEKLETLTNLLAIRFRGIDPEPFLRVLYPRVRWMFSRFAMLTSLVVIFGALLSLMVYAETFVSRLPRLQTFISVENLMLMAVVLACCKVIHELGHALVCKHFGGECRELGVMLLVFTPCLYCNVSDAWMMRSKWKRIAISAAGIYVELLLASLCTFLWWFSQPGVLNSIFLNIMFICSISTILFNGNPLLRYDGYFILADLVEIPNLRQQAQSFWRQLAAKCLGLEPRAAWTLQRRDRAQLAFYGVASLIYRWALVAGILFVVYRALEPYRLETIAQLFSVFVLGGMFFAPVWQLVRVARTPRHGRGRQRWRMACILLAFAGGIILLGMIPVSRHVTAPIVVEPANATRVHVTVPGTLTRFATIGQQLAKGDVIVELMDPQLEREVTALSGERDVQKLYTQQLQMLQVLERGAAKDGAGSQIVTANEALAATERRLDQKLGDHARLTIMAPQPGIVMPDRPRRPQTMKGQLPTWSGTPLDDRNLGSHLDPDTVVCLIGNPSDLKGIALIDSTNIERVERGQSVRMIVDELHEHVLIGTVVEIARVEVSESPPELVAKQLLPSDTTDSTKSYYAVSVALRPGQKSPLLWSSGRVKIAVNPLTLAEVIYRQLCDTFRIDL